MTNQRPRKKLNEAQTEVLEVLYKFRFATLKLIVTYQELQSEVYTYKRLRKLVADGYIARHYDGNYKIHGKPAIYYITKKGIGYLKINPDLSVKALNGMYRDGTASEAFMKDSLDIFRVFVKFNELYGNKLSFYGKAELTELDYFPRPLPDAYIELDTRHDPQQYMMELIDMTISYTATKRRLDRYVHHFESGEWGVTDTGYPTLLIICENAMTDRRIQRIVANLIDEIDIHEIRIYTTTLKAFIGLGDGNSAIWTNVMRPEELIALMSQE